MKILLDKVNELIEHGWSCKEQKSDDQWLSRVKQILTAGFDQEVAREFMSLREEFGWEWEEDRPKQIGYLEGLALKIFSESISNQKDVTQKSPNTTPATSKTNKVFIVHGHDSATKESKKLWQKAMGSGLASCMLSLLTKLLMGTPFPAVHQNPGQIYLIPHMRHAVK